MANSEHVWNCICGRQVLVSSPLFCSLGSWNNSWRCLTYPHQISIDMIQRKCHRLATQRKSTLVDRKPSGDARNLRHFATCVNFRTFTSPYTSSAFANSRGFFASTCESVWPGFLVRESDLLHLAAVYSGVIKLRTVRTSMQNNQRINKSRKEKSLKSLRLRALARPF